MKKIKLYLQALAIRLFTKLVISFAESFVTKVTLYYDFNNNRWAFDDEAKGLKAEGFHFGIGKMIVGLVQNEPFYKLQTYELAFSPLGFFNAQARLEWVQKGGDGNWYAWNGLEGWLCPELYKYFDVAPREIYVRITRKED